MVKKKIDYNFQKNDTKIMLRTCLAFTKRLFQTIRPHVLKMMYFRIPGDVTGNILSIAHDAVI